MVTSALTLGVTGSGKLPATTISKMKRPSSPRVGETLLGAQAKNDHTGQTGEEYGEDVDL